VRRGPSSRRESENDSEGMRVVGGGAHLRGAFVESVLVDSPHQLEAGGQQALC
jgi:hypothetical protein